MSPIQMQLAKEARYDVRVALIGLALLFGCMLLLPRDWFWFYFTPLAAFWYRYLWVRCQRDDILEHMDAEATPPIPGCYAAEGGGICIDDGTTRMVVGNSSQAGPAPKILPYTERRLLPRLDRT